MLRAAKNAADEILRAVGRSGVADDPAVNVIGNRAETALEIRHLVLDNHVEAKRLRGRHWQVIGLDLLNSIENTLLAACNIQPQWVSSQ